jgi:hypothetical protein
MNSQSPLRPLVDHRYLLVLLLLTSAIFYKGITPSFSSDDFVHLENNIHYENLTAAAEVFVKPYGREYRPLVRLSLWLNHQMGDTALPYKISNLLMHLLCVALLYGLLLRLSVSKSAALVASSIFALHPIHITSVHFILGRTDLVAAVFYLATLYCFCNWRNNPGIALRALTFIWFSAALLSKELSITLPVMMLAIAVTQQKTRAVSAIFRAAIRLWPYILLAFIYLVARLYQWKTMDTAVAVYTNFSPLNIVKNYAEWAFALLYPFDLYVAREWLILHTGLFVAAATAASLILIALAIYIWRQTAANILRSPLFWLGLGWLLITLLPMSGGNSHRWYLYLPSAGFCMMVAAAWTNVPLDRAALLRVVLTVMLIIFSGESLRQSLAWNQQSAINEDLLSETHTEELRNHDAIAIANMPFGYQGTFLFTHSAYEEALRVRYGKSPRIQVLNYLNLDAENTVAIAPSPTGATFTITPTAYRYFRLRDLRIFFAQNETDTQGEFKLQSNKLDGAGRIVSLSIEVPENSAVPLYYFDGRKFKRLDGHKNK